MECKIKALFISIALSFLIGFITQNHSLGTESVYTYDYLLDQQEACISESELSNEANAGDALRHFSPSKRTNSSPTSRDGLTSIKGYYVEYSSPTIFESTQRFLSRLGEGRKRLISFGVLII